MVLEHLVGHLLWSLIEKGFGRLQGSELEKLVGIVHSTIDRTFQGDPYLANTLKGIFNDKKVAQQMGRYLTDKQVSIDTLSEAFKQTDCYQQIQDRCNPKALFSDILTAIEQEMEKDTEFRHILTLCYFRSILGKIDNVESLLHEIRDWLAPQTYNKLELYGNYFNAIARLKRRELERLGLYTDLHVIDARVALMKGEKIGEPEKAIDLIRRRISGEGQNLTLFIGESGSGKTFTSLKLFESLMKDYLDKDKKPDKIPLFVELYKRHNYDSFETMLRNGIPEEAYLKDRENYIVFLDGLNETDNPKERLKEVVDFTARNQKTRFFVSTQRLEESWLNEEDLFGCYQLQQFKNDDIISYLLNFRENFPNKQEAQKFYDSLDPILQEHVKRPVFLYMLAAASTKDSPPRNLGEMFERFEEFICAGHARHPTARGHLEEKYRNRVLPFLAFQMCKGFNYKKEKEEKVVVPPGRRDLTPQELDGCLELYNDENRLYQITDASKFLREVKERYWIAKEGDGFQFTLEFLRDYFAARYVQNTVAAGFSLRETLMGLVFPGGADQPDPTFSSISEILCGIISEPQAVEIIESILPKDPYLAASCFARSSITSLQEELLWKINGTISPNNPRYFPSLNRIVQFYKKALEVYEQNQMQNHPDYGHCQMNLGNALSDKLDYDGAISAYGEALKVYEQNQMQNHPSYGLCQMNLGWAYYKKGDRREALARLRRARQIFEDNITRKAIPQDTRGISYVWSGLRRLGETIK